MGARKPIATPTIVETSPRSPRSVWLGMIHGINTGRLIIGASTLHIRCALLEPGDACAPSAHPWIHSWYTLQAVPLIFWLAIVQEP